jgi:hypothetical protein
MTIKEATEVYARTRPESGDYQLWLDIDGSEVNQVGITVNIKSWYPVWLVSLILRYKIFLMRKQTEKAEDGLRKILEKK